MRKAYCVSVIAWGVASTGRPEIIMPNIVVEKLLNACAMQVQGRLTEASLFQIETRMFMVQKHGSRDEM